MHASVGGRGGELFFLCGFEVVDNILFTKNVVKEVRERERSFLRQDEAVRSANEARNTLENLVYSTRSVAPFVCSVH